MINKCDIEKDVDLIPEGHYCYTITGIDGLRINTKCCPFWDKDDDREDQDSGYCHFLEQGDWECEGMSLLWDQCKECGENYDDDEFEDEDEL